MDALMTAQDVAKLLRLSEQQVYRLMSRGELGNVRIGTSRRVPKEALERFLNEHTEGVRAC